MSNSIMRFRLSRRTLLQGAGGGLLLAAGGLILPSRVSAAQAVATADETYKLENGFLSLSGSFGKLTRFALDPSGAGNYEPSSFHSVFIGAEDFFDAGFNSGVAHTLSATKLSLSGIQLPSVANLTQSQVGSPVPMSTGQTLGQSFTTSMYRFSKVGGQLPTWGSHSSGVTMTLYAGTPETTLTKIAQEVFSPLQDNGWAYLNVPGQPAGKYYLELSSPTGTPGWWSHLGGTTVDVKGFAYNNRQRSTERTMAIDVAGFNVDGTATWDLELGGGSLTSTYDIQWLAEGRPDPGLMLNAPWIKDGYSVAYGDGIPFNRFWGDSGDYMPAEQLKRRGAWITPVEGAASVTATGGGPYDLRITGDTPVLDGTMSAETMALTLNSGSADAAPQLSRTIGFVAETHTEVLPDIFPVFTASDATRATQLSTFYWERALSFRFTNHAMSWADWEGRILDWTGTAGSGAQKDTLLAVPQDDDGYVWAWPDRQGWPFPDPNLFDTRHFTSNALYILGVWRYYSWTGDEEFLTTTLPRVRRAMDFYLNELGGNTGLLTITSPDHDGTDGSLPSNYWDVTSFGYQDAYANAYFYGALEALVQLEKHDGRSERAEQLKTLRKLAKKQYNATFWNDEAGRYVQTIDVNGVVHDYGATYVNLEAASFGLPTAKQAERIFDWLDNGHTELQEPIILVESGGLAPSIAPGHSLGQSFTADAGFTSVGARFPTYGARGAAFTMTLYSGMPGSTQVKIKEQHYTDWFDGKVAHIDFDEQAPGVYYLEVSGVTGALAWWSSQTPVSGVSAFADGLPDPNAKTRFIVVLADHVEGPADIYSKWVFAPRSTTRRNSYWFFLTHLSIPWGDEVQDGGAILYTSGFDVMARAKYRSADDAWARMTTILDRWSEPDHISGGSPLFRGETTVDGTAVGKSVGTDIPFPESGLVPASFLYAFVGVEAEPNALVITPNLPSSLSDAGVRHLRWRGKKLDIVATRHTVTVTGDGVLFTKNYNPGQSVRLNASAL